MIHDFSASYAGYIVEDNVGFQGPPASDYAANINAQTFMVYGSQVSLMSQPRPSKAVDPEGKRLLPTRALLMPEQS